MRIALLTLGTRGDFQPYLALGQGLARAGFQVTLAASTDFADEVAAAGLDYVPLRCSMRAIAESADGRAALAGDPRAIVRLVRHSVLPMTRDMLDDCWTAARDADAVVYHPKTLAGPHLAEKRGVPTFVGIFMPILTPTRAFPLPILTRRSLGPAFNRLSYRLMDASTFFLRGIVKRWRRETLGLSGGSARVREADLPVLYAFSEHLIPAPADWPGRARVTGFWFRDFADDWSPPPDLAEFLAAGPPPVYVGFGSMTSRDPAKTAAIVAEAVRRAGCRAIVADGWGGMAAANDAGTILGVREVPHEWLFPRVAAVLHHGGAGTTAAGLRAGRPTVICPFTADQPFWGAIVHRLGLGPRPVPQKTLSVDRLAEAIGTAVGDDGIQSAAATMGRKLSEEDGMASAVRIISETLDGRRA